MWALFDLDCELFRSIHGALFGTAWAKVLYVIQQAGKWQGMVPLLLLAVALAPRGRRAQVGFRLLASLLVAAACGQVVKRVVRAPRPASLMPAEMNQDFFKESPSDGDFARHGYSWPSGHTTAVFAVAAALLALRASWPLVGAAFLVAALTGLGRVVLGAHFPSDVLAGALLGSLVAWLMARPLERVEAWLARRPSLAAYLAAPGPIPVAVVATVAPPAALSPPPS